MLDFPASPAVGQTFSSSNAQWRWDGVKWLDNSVGQLQTDTGRNLFHNGLFNIQQRGTGAWTANMNYTADRWVLGLTLDTNSASIATLTDAERTQIGDEAAQYCFRDVVTGNAGASAYSIITQFIENIRRLAGKTATVSFWAKAASGTPKIGIGVGQNFGTGGSPSAFVGINGQSVTISTTWARYSATFSIPSVAGKTLGTNGNDNTEIDFYFSSGSTNATGSGNVGVQSGTFSLWGVQVEIGAGATALEKRDPHTELQLCQRFYSLGEVGFFGYGGAGAQIGTAVTLPAQMRSPPAVTLISPGYNNASGAATSAILANAFIATAVATATGVSAFTANYTASADL